MSRSRLVASSYEQFNFASSSSTLTRKKYNTITQILILFQESGGIFSILPRTKVKRKKENQKIIRSTKTLAKSVDAETFVFACPLELARGVEIRR